jgi:hypothetical protein
MNMATAQTSYRVEFNFTPVGACPAADLEALVADVLDTIDEYTSESVTGAAAAVSYDPPGLEVSITVDATSLAHLHRVLAEVLQALEEHAGLAELAGTSFAETAQPDDEREPVPA